MDKTTFKLATWNVNSIRIRLDLLKKLADNRGNIVTIDALCAALWDGPMVGYENTLMVHIRRLREKIEADPSHPKYLLTVRGLGYRLVREGTR